MSCQVASSFVVSGGYEFTFTIAGDDLVDFSTATSIRGAFRKKPGSPVLAEVAMGSGVVIVDPQTITVTITLPRGSGPVQYDLIAIGATGIADGLPFIAGTMVVVDTITEPE